MRTLPTQYNPEYFIENRRKFAEKMKDSSIAVIFSGAPVRKSADAHYPFHANRNFVYLTGIEQEHSALVIIKSKSNGYSEKLIIKPYDPHYTRWTGRLLSASEAVAISGVQKVLTNDEFQGSQVFEFSGVADAFYLDMDHDCKQNSELKDVVASSGFGLFEDCFTFFKELRSIKNEYEINSMVKAAQITAQGMKAAVRSIVAGKREYEIAAAFEHRIAQLGAGEPSFDTIVAAGDNFNCLHYPQLDCVIGSNDLVLIDCGASWNNIAADVTRAFPVSGKFNPTQRKVYLIVQKCFEKALEIYKPGVTIKEVNDKLKEFSTELLSEAGILKDGGKVEDYYWHNVSHHIGYDVHDIISRDTVLEEGMTLTVEPGIYVPELSVGLRIEDDILITSDGCRNLTYFIPYKIDEIEKFVADVRGE